MKAIRFSPGAFADLDDIFGFYEGKETGLGEYFRSRINEDIEGLIITAGIHRKTFKDYHSLLSRFSRTQFTTRSPKARSSSGRWSIVGGIPIGSRIASQYDLPWSLEFKI